MSRSDQPISDEFDLNFADSDLDYRTRFCLVSQARCKRLVADDNVAANHSTCHRSRKSFDWAEQCNQLHAIWQGLRETCSYFKTSSIVDHVTDLIDTYDSQVFPVEHFTKPLGSVSLDDSLSPR